jgi:hypothetical protein
VEYSRLGNNSVYIFLAIRKQFNTPINKAMKRILEWYEMLPKEIRDKAIANYDGDLEYTYTLHEAIQMGFSWGSSPEKHDYWYSVYQNCIDDDYIQ